MESSGTSDLACVEHHLIEVVMSGCEAEALMITCFMLQGVKVVKVRDVVHASTSPSPWSPYPAC